MNRTVLALFTLAASTATAQAGFVYTHQERRILAWATAEVGDIYVEDSRSAPDFGPFNEYLEVTARSTDMTHSGWGTASQHSTLDPLRIRVSGGWTGGRSGGHGGAGGGTSSFNVAFTLDAASAFTLYAYADSSFVFAGPDGFLIDATGNYSGTLQAGGYSMSALTMGSGGGPASGGGISVDLTLVPTPWGVAAFTPIALNSARRRRI